MVEKIGGGGGGGMADRHPDADGSPFIGYGQSPPPPRSPRRAVGLPLTFTLLSSWEGELVDLNRRCHFDHMLCIAKHPLGSTLTKTWGDAHAEPLVDALIQYMKIEEMFNKQRIPTIITWSYDGKEVSVEGSWDDWKTWNPLQRSGKDFTTVQVPPSGVYQYRFIVDGQYRYAPDLPWPQDEAGNPPNILDSHEYVPEDTYDNMQLGGEDYAREPLIVPPHLQMTLLEVPASHMEYPPPSRPQHVVLNHLYMHKGWSSPSAVALSFLVKYITVVLCKSIQR